QVGVLVEINAETDFVAKNQKFLDYAEQVLTAALDSGATDADALAEVEVDGSTVKELTDGMQAVIGEKIVVRRVGRLEADKIELYLHRTNPDLPAQVGVLVGTDAKAAEVAHDVAMHIAAYSPEYATRDDVPAEVVDKERAIAEETTRAEGKPEKAIPKIVEGRLSGFFKENVLVDQAFAKDPKTTVGKVVEATGGELTGFVRFRVGA
ncbi:translation elongation factor Ts, partial [Actinomyces naeslundii]